MKKIFTTFLYPLPAIFEIIACTADRGFQIFHQVKTHRPAEFKPFQLPFFREALVQRQFFGRFLGAAEPVGGLFAGFCGFIRPGKLFLSITCGRTES